MVHDALPPVTLAGFLAALLCSSSVWSEPDAPLETLLVTAHRVVVPAADAGSSASRLDRDLLERRQTIHAADLLQDVTSVSVSRVAGYGSQTQLRLRGAEANQVLVLIDGVKANDPAGSDEFDFSLLTAYDIEQIEVIRGPQSALWGSEATAGVINITTRQVSGGPGASGFVEGGSNDTFYGGGRFGTGSDSAGISFNGSYFDSAGESSALAGSEPDGSRNLTAGINGFWAPGQNSRISFSGRYTDAEVAFDGLDFATGLPADADLVSNNELLLLKAEARSSVFDEHWDHLARLTWLDSDRHQLRDGDWDSGTSARKLGAYYQSTVRLDPASQQLIFGLDYEREEFEQRGAAGFFDPNQDQERDKVGAVLEYLVAPASGLNLSASLRRDDNSDFDDVTTYRLTASFMVPSGNTRVRTSFGTGQKAPTFIELYGFYPDFFTGNPDLEPETSRGFDVGLSQRLFGTWQAELGYFNERLDNEIVTVFLPDTSLSSVENLDGSSRREGAEAELQGRLTDRLSLALSYTYTDSKDPQGVREIRRPRHMAAANLHLDALRGRAGVNLNLSYTGSQTDRVFLPPSYQGQTVALDDYLLVNLTGSYRFTERFELYLRADNLADEDYLNVAGYRTPGRSVHLGIRLGLIR